VVSHIRPNAVWNTQVAGAQKCCGAENGNVIDQNGIALIGRDVFHPVGERKIREWVVAVKMGSG